MCACACERSRNKIVWKNEFIEVYSMCVYNVVKVYSVFFLCLNYNKINATYENRIKSDTHILLFICMHRTALVFKSARQYFID